MARLQRPAAFLLALDGLELRLEVAFSEALRTLGYLSDDIPTKSVWVGVRGLRITVPQSILAFPQLARERILIRNSFGQSQR